MHKFGGLLLAVLFIILSARVASADTCAIRTASYRVPLADLHLSRVPLCDSTLKLTPAPDGQVIGSGIIYLYANDEAKNSSLNNVLYAIQELEGKTIAPGETFSFNDAASLLQETIPYDLGPDVWNNLVKAGGVCMVSSMIATAVHDAGLPFVNEAGRIISLPVPHSRYYKYYHQVNRVNNHDVPIIEAAVAIQKYAFGQPWQTVQDLRFVNNTDRTIVLHFEPSFSVNDLDLSQPFGRIQKDHSLKVELLAVPHSVDRWLFRLVQFGLN